MFAPSRTFVVDFAPFVNGVACHSEARGMRPAYDDQEELVAWAGDVASDTARSLGGSASAVPSAAGAAWRLHFPDPTTARTVMHEACLAMDRTKTPFYDRGLNASPFFAVHDAERPGARPFRSSDGWADAERPQSEVAAREADVTAREARLEAREARLRATRPTALEARPRATRPTTRSATKLPLGRGGVSKLLMRTAAFRSPARATCSVRVDL